MNTTDRNALVQASWNQVQRRADAFAVTFYATLFELDATLEPMFRTDPALQRVRLVAMIDAAVGLLDRPDDLVPALRALGKRHGGYGVRDAHYATVGTALLRSLAVTLHDAYTPPVCAAWTAVYGVISATMMDAARPSAQPIASRPPRTAAVMAMALAAGAAVAAEPGPFGTHPALSPRSAAVTAATRPAIDPNTFILGHPASPTTRGGHANFEHPAVLTARLAGRPSIDPNTCIVLPPAAVTWRVEPEEDVGSRMAQAPGPVEAQSR